MVVTKAKGGANESAKLVEALFEEFVQAGDSVDILLTFHKLKAAIGAENLDNGRELYTILKSKLQSWKCKSLWDVLDARAKHKEYGNGKICEDLQVLVIGSGPIGLRTAIEVALLGAKVIVVEKRTSFSRNNVLHLWPFLIPDFRSLGAKKFYGKFCSGSLDHIGIRMLQCLLMKAALILGVQIYTGVTFEKVIEPTSDCGWRCQIDPPFHPASQFDLDMIVGADGKKNVLPGFPQIEMRGSLAIGITLNLVYHGTKQEAAIPEVSGLAYHFKPQFFDELYQKNGVRLENFVYYKGETHYFVMTAVKSSLLARGALIMDYPKPADLLAPQNVNHERLIEYALDAVKFGTEGKLTDIEFVKNGRGKSDIAVFDFTSLKKAEHAAKIVERNGHRLLMALVGDSLIEPFWPTGSGCARGVLSALDTAWMLRSFAMDRPPLQVLSERENIYKLLSATSVDNLRKNYDAYTINPFTRYVNLNLKRVKEVYHLYDADDPVNADFRVGSPTGVGSLLENTKRRLSVTNRNMVKPGKNRRKSSSDDLDEKKGRNRTRKSSSDDLDEKKDTKSRRKSIKQALRRRHSRDTDNELNDVTPNSKTKSKKSVKKIRNQSSESADEKEVRGRRHKKLGRTKSRDTDGSNNSLDTITESPKTAAKNERIAENKDNSLLMKQRSTKRWRLFGGTKPKLHSLDKDTKSNVNEKENMAAKKDEQENAKKLKRNAESEKKEALKNGSIRNELTEQKGTIKSVPESQAKTAVSETQANERPKRGLAKTLSKDKATSTDPKGGTGLPPIAETYTKSALRQLNSQESSSPKLLRYSLRKPSELRAGQDTGFTRSISSGAATLPRATSSGSGQVKRTDRAFASLRRARETTGLEPKVDSAQNDVIKKGNVREASEGTGAKNETKRAKLDIKRGRESVFDDVQSLSPAAQRTAPLLKTLTPEKKDGKYQDGGAVTAAAGIAAMLALTTPLAMEGKQSLRGFQLDRQRILASGQVNVREKIALLDSVSNSDKKPRRDLTSALDSADGGPKPVKRYSSFSTVQRNVKPKLDDDSQKSLTLPRKAFSRQSLQENIFSSHSDIPSALDSAIDILIKSYSFNKLQGTLKIILNIFRCISKDPDDETPRRIWTDGQLFRTLVWNVNEAKLFMVVSGWMEIGNFIVFPKTKTPHEAIRVLMQNYRQLWEKHHLDTSFVPPESSVKYRRRPSDVFQKQTTNPEHARGDGKDTGSHSGSDSGMGFSETASEHNIPAVMSLKHTEDADVFADDARGPTNKPGQWSEMMSEGVNSAKRSSQVLDPRLYLEASYNQEEHDRKLNPADYLNHSTVIPEQPTASTSIPKSPMVSPSEPTFSKGHPSKSLKKHLEILEEPAPTPQSPQGILYAPSHQAPVTQADYKRSSFRESRQLASQLDDMMEEPMDYDPNVAPQDSLVQRYPSNDDINSKLSDSEVFTKEAHHNAKTSNKQRTNSKRKNELDDLFETLDLVSEALSPPRVVYEEKPKKNRSAAKSTEASRRREERIRNKLQATSKEEQTLTTKRKTRSQAPRGKQIAGGKSSDNNVQQATERDRGRKIGSRKQDVIHEVDEKVPGDTPRTRRRHNQTADHSTTEPLRRSQRIAESSAKSRKAMLILDPSGYPEESSTDLNQAFVNSTLNESKHESSFQDGSIDGDETRGHAAGQKKKVRRQSSIVKSNKSRVRTKRNGFKSRKDRSIDT